jgi:hypothetical protein
MHADQSRLKFSFLLFLRRTVFKRLVLCPGGLAVCMAAALPCRAQTTLPFQAFQGEQMLAAAERPEAFADAVRSRPLLKDATKTVDDALPEAPTPQQADPKPLVAAKPTIVPVTTERPVVSRYSKYIPAGAAAPQIHGREKLILGARDLYSPGNFLDMVFSAGWGQLTNSQPNYGTNGDAFGKRVGAAAIRETSEGILTDGVFAVMLHEDPRYFVLGPKSGLMNRTLYAITRPLITRNSSDGHTTVNGAMLLGFAASAALTNTYYPKINRNFGDTARTFGGSLGGAAIGFSIDEFSGQVLEAVHLKKRR